MKREISLNGNWRFAPMLNYRKTTNYNLLKTNVPLYALPQLNRQDWEWARVPGVWQRISERYSIYEGICWYCRTFNVSGLQKDTLSILRFGGVINNAEVYVNGKEAGRHESGYTEFILNVSDLLEEGENFIAVMVDNRAEETKWPGERGYFAYGGIHRDVTLELYDGTFIEKVNAVPVLEEDSGHITVEGILHGDSPEITVALGNDVRKITVSPDETGFFKEEIVYSNVKKWTPDSPELYVFTVAYDDAVYADWEMGFRNFYAENGKIYLNGAEFRVKGTCYVYDSPVEGLVMTEEQLSVDLSEMKEAGVNFIRTHYPMDEKFYRLCDRMGFLVWIEPNIYCSKPLINTTDTVFARPGHVHVAEIMVTEMIAAAKRHACVGIYGIGNECNMDHPEAQAFFPRLAALVRSLDNTRAVSFAALLTYIGNLPDYVDILGINQYYGWYGRVSDINDFKKIEEKDGVVKVDAPDLTPFHSLMELVQQAVPKNIPLLLTEFGGDSIPGYHSSSADLWSEEYHEKVIEEMIKIAGEYSQICGTFVFCFTDYLDPAKPWNGGWKGLNYKGMLTYNRDRRRAFYAMQKVYKAEEK